MSDDKLSPVSRVTVSLIPKAATELSVLQAQTGMSRTDLVNRAVSLYAMWSDEVAAGREFKVHDPATGETQSVRVL